jgi:hypothetical protein
MQGGVIDEIGEALQSYDDQGLSERFSGKGIEIRRLVNEYLHRS